jgi:putative oxidoreductase
MSKLNCLLNFIARVLIAAIFLFGAAGKFFNYEHMGAYMQTKGLTNIPVLLYIAAFVELFAGIALIIGYRTKLAAFVLFLFLIPVTYIMHDFWNLQGQEQMQNLVHFFCNLAIAGGLLLIMSSNSGKNSSESNR